MCMLSTGREILCTVKNIHMVFKKYFFHAVIVHFIWQFIQSKKQTALVAQLFGIHFVSVLLVAMMCHSTEYKLTFRLTLTSAYVLLTSSFLSCLQKFVIVI